MTKNTQTPIRFGRREFLKGSLAVGAVLAKPPRSSSGARPPTNVS